jgi:Mg-chelatase subunit ChlI
VTVESAHSRLISAICVQAQVQGHSADVVIRRTAQALAALRRHPMPSRDDIYDAAGLALAHRARAPERRDPRQLT